MERYSFETHVQPRWLATKRDSIQSTLVVEACLRGQKLLVTDFACVKLEFP